MGFRFHSENDLSDFIWTCCESCEQFKWFFLSFFFNNIDFSRQIDLIREYSKDNCRPDFIILTDGQLTHLIEVKIQDQYDHFEDYINTFPMIGKGNRGFIMNYSRNARSLRFSNDYCIHTWEEFLVHLASEIKKSDRDRELSEFYNFCYTYIKQVCNYREAVHMELSHLGSLEALNLTFRKIIANSTEHFLTLGIKVNEYRFKAGVGYSGFYFRMETPKLPYPLYPWFGIMYQKQEISVMFESLSTYCDQLIGKQITIPNEEMFTSEPPDRDVLINLKLNSVQEIFDDGDQYTAEQQYMKLNDFFRRCIEAVQERL